MGQAAEVIWYLRDESKSPLSFPHFLSHICVTRLVKSLSLKLPRSMGHQSEKLSNMRKSERERDGEKVREIGLGMIANCLSNGCHPGSHFRWLVIRHERGRPARIPLLTLLRSGPLLLKSFRLSPVTSSLKTALYSVLDALFSSFLPLCSFLHVSPSPTLPHPPCSASLWLLLSSCCLVIDQWSKKWSWVWKKKKKDLEAKHSLPILTAYCSS